ncbi:MAG: hypothetical protein Tsb0016_08890 [Sphingomonadales bacterium]
MDMTTTLIIMAVAAMVLTLTIILERRGWSQARVRLVPLAPVQFLAVLVLLVMAGHVISLVTGTPFEGRLGR